MIQLRALRDRFRGSLFYVPSLFVATSALLAWGVIRFEGTIVADRDSVFLLSVTVESARAILSTIAGATITVAGIVFSVTVVSVQLASSQFSPRVLRGFLRDRFQQAVIGIIVGTFTYCTLVLATVRVTGAQDSDQAGPSLSVTIAITLAVASILGIVAFIDHSARSMQVGHIIRRVTTETRDRIADLYVDRGDDRRAVVEEVPPEPSGEPFIVRAWTDGWIQQLSERSMRRATAPGSYLRVDSGVGAFVVEDTPLVTIWGDDEPDLGRMRDAFVIGAERTMQQDVMFGIRQLVDIGLRALSTGVNDPTTAYEVIVHLGSILSDVLRRDLPPRVRRDEEGRTLVLSERHDHEAHVERAFGQLRIAGAGQPAVLIRLLRTLHLIDRLMLEVGQEDRRRPIRRQAELVLATARHADYIDEDLETIHREAEQLGFLDPAPGGRGAGQGD